ncbi:beta-1,4-galactosyltransferase 1-like isoform X1 [Arapaima gigas]
MRQTVSNCGSLHKVCTLIVFLGFIHLLCILIYYVKTLDIKFATTRFQNIQATVQTGAEWTATSAPYREPDPPVTNRSALSSAVDNSGKLDVCPDESPLLVGPLRVEFSEPLSLDTVRANNPKLLEGGHYKPKDCIALQKVAIIIPFRHRDEHLKFWLHYLHPILQRQQLDYGVYIINQDGEQIFNRAKLMNIGYVEALKEYNYECFVFSDVDLIPMDDRNIYKCYDQPRHLSVSMDKFGYKLPYKQYFGGVSALSKNQYLKINGFPNNYWGWGGEDDDIYNRINYRRMLISRPDSEVGKCRMIRHSRDEKNDANPQRFNRIAHTRETMNRDGINSLVYQVLKVEKDKLYTKITVDVGKPT